MKLAEKSENRLKSIIKKDKGNLPVALISLIKSEVYDVINSYFSTDIEDVKVKYFVDENGKYIINIEALCSNIKKMNYLSF